jgi:hypothetical protein
MPSAVAREVDGERPVAINLDDIACLDDLEKAAAQVLVKQDYDYYAGGVGSYDLFTLSKVLPSAIWVPTPHVVPNLPIQERGSSNKLSSTSSPRAMDPLARRDAARACTPVARVPS